MSTQCRPHMSNPYFKPLAVGLQLHETQKGFFMEKDKKTQFFRISRSGWTGIYLDVSPKIEYGGALAIYG